MADPSLGGFLPHSSPPEAGADPGPALTAPFSHVCAADGNPATLAGGHAAAVAGGQDGPVDGGHVPLHLAGIRSPAVPVLAAQVGPLCTDSSWCLHGVAVVPPGCSGRRCRHVSQALVVLERAHVAVCGGRLVCVTWLPRHYGCHTGVSHFAGWCRNYMPGALPAIKLSHPNPMFNLRCAPHRSQPSSCA